MQVRVKTYHVFLGSLGNGGVGGIDLIGEEKGALWGALQLARWEEGSWSPTSRSLSNRARFICRPKIPG